jgi:hypothetical protein
MVAIRVKVLSPSKKQARNLDEISRVGVLSPTRFTLKLDLNKLMEEIDGCNSFN